MKTEKPSLSDLAKKLNVSKTTVSFILNGKGRTNQFSDALVKKVKTEALSIGYHPNQFAKSLRTGRTNIIGLMVEDISNPFYASIAKRIEEKVYLNGYRIAYCSTENDKKRAREFLSMFTTLGVDGCIIAPPIGVEQDIRDMVDDGMHVVLFDRQFKNKTADAVMVDNQLGMYTAVTHLIDRGHKHIALIALALDKPEKEDRIIGYKKAVVDHGLEPQVYPLPFKVQPLDYVNEVRTILREHQELDAVVFGTNYLGISGLEAIHQLGLRIPEDLAVVSFDDHDLFRIHKPSISVVAQPIEEIAQTVIDTLLLKLKTPDEKNSAKTITLPTTLIARNSS